MRNGHIFNYYRLCACKWKALQLFEMFMKYDIMKHFDSTFLFFTIVGFISLVQAMLHEGFSFHQFSLILNWVHTCVILQILLKSKHHGKYVYGKRINDKIPRQLLYDKIFGRHRKTNMCNVINN